MKTKLDEAREIINNIDDEMISLYLKRMAAVKMVCEYKIENNIPILDTGREHILVEKNIEKLGNKEIEPYYLEFFNGVLSSSKDYQEFLMNKSKEK